MTKLELKQVELLRLIIKEGELLHPYIFQALSEGEGDDKHDNNAWICDILRKLSTAGKIDTMYEQNQNNNEKGFKKNRNTEDFLKEILSAERKKQNDIMHSISERMNKQSLDNSIEEANRATVELSKHQIKTNKITIWVSILSTIIAVCALLYTIYSENNKEQKDEIINNKINGLEIKVKSLMDKSTNTLNKLDTIAK
jgi:hypothetical protein